MPAGKPIPPLETAATLMAKLTGSALLAAGALLYGAGTSQAATLAPPTNDGSRWALSAPGGAAAPAWSNQAAWKDQANTFSAAQVISAATGLTVLQAVTQDAIALIGRAGGTSSYIASITCATLSGNRTATLPDASIVVAGSASALTSGRVPYATTGGLLLDHADITANPGGATVLTIGSSSRAASTYGVLNSAAGQLRCLAIQSGGSYRWLLGSTATAESGSDAGSNFVIYAYSDAGSQIDAPFSIARASGGTITLARPVTATGTVIVPNGTASAPGIRLTSEAHGLYRNASTSMAFACAGAYVADFTGASAGNWAAFLRISTIADPGMIIGNSTNSLIIYGSDTGSSQGGQLRAYGSTHGSRANYVEFTRGATVSGYFDGSGKFFLNYTATGAMRLAGNGDGSTGSIDSIYGDLLKYKRYGYSNSYSAAMLGASTRGISLGVDTSAIAGSSFTGNNNDILVNRGAVIRCANSGGTDWLAAIKISGGAVSASTPVLEIADGLATFIKPLSVTDTTSSTSYTTGALTVGGGIGFGGGLFGSRSSTNTNGVSVAQFSKTDIATANGAYSTRLLDLPLRNQVSAGIADTGSKANVYVENLRNYVLTADAGTVSWLKGASLSLGHYNTDASAPVTTNVIGIDVLPYAMSGTITRFMGFNVNPVISGGTLTNIYAFRGQVVSAAGAYNLYMDGTASNHLAGNLLIGTTTDGMTANGSVAIAQDLAHRGSKVGFYNAAPVTRPTYAAWTGTANRATKDTATATLVDVAQTIKALIDDLRTVGLFA